MAKALGYGTYCKVNKDLPPTHHPPSTHPTHPPIHPPRPLKLTGFNAKRWGNLSSSSSAR